MSYLRKLVPFLLKTNFTLKKLQFCLDGRRLPHITTNTSRVVPKERIFLWKDVFSSSFWWFLMVHHRHRGRWTKLPVGISKNMESCLNITILVTVYLCSSIVCCETQTKRSATKNITSNVRRWIIVWMNGENRSKQANDDSFTQSKSGAWERNWARQLVNL